MKIGHFKREEKKKGSETTMKIRFFFPKQTVEKKSKSLGIQLGYVISQDISISQICVTSCTSLTGSTIQNAILIHPFTWEPIFEF